jgi:hypothetical protein
MAVKSRKRWPAQLRHLHRVAAIACLVGVHAACVETVEVQTVRGAVFVYDEPSHTGRTVRELPIGEVLQATTPSPLSSGFYRLPDGPDGRPRYVDDLDVVEVPVEGVRRYINTERYVVGALGSAKEVRRLYRGDEVAVWHHPDPLADGAPSRGACFLVEEGRLAGWLNTNVLVAERQ